MQLDQLLQGTSLPVLLAVGCCLLCVVGVLITVLTPVFDLLGGLLELVTGLFSAGPVPGCGCVAVIALIAGVLVCGWLVLSVLDSCGTVNPMNFCTLFGR